MKMRSNKHPCVILALIANMPNVLEAVQGKCITKANCKKDSKLFYVSKTSTFYKSIIILMMSFFSSDKIPFSLLSKIPGGNYRVERKT